MRILSVCAVAGTLALAAMGCGGEMAAGDEEQLAAQGRRGKGKVNTNPCPSCVLGVSPNPVPYGTTSIVVSGSGFAPSKTVYLDTGELLTVPVAADVSGTFALTYLHGWASGANGIVAYSDPYRSSYPLASISFTVCTTNPCP